eukprot:2124649-Alexandrium_andersonii.AAC.1
MPAGPFRRQTRHLRKKQHRVHPSGASGPNLDTLSGPAQFKFCMPEAISYFLGSESSGESRGAPGSSGELGS